MEVHHHPDLHHKRKNFKEYFLEFLMIFLAVTMGFLAEGLRENISDKEKEKEYVSSFIKNLEEDTSILRSSIAENRAKMNGLDSLLALTPKNMDNPEIRKLLYRYSFLYISFYSIFISNDATMIQLKNSGGLRFIRKNHVADSIAKYDFNVRDIYAAEAPYQKGTYDAEIIAQEILVDYVYRDSSFYKDYQFTNKKLPLLTTDPQKLSIFFNKVSYERGWTKNYLNNLEEKLPYTTSLIAFLKKEYGEE